MKTTFKDVNFSEVFCLVKDLEKDPTEDEKVYMKIKHENSILAVNLTTGKTININTDEDVVVYTARLKITDF